MVPNENTQSLRRALLADAAASGMTAALMIVGAEIAAAPLGLPEALLRGAGFVLLPYVAFVLLVATRERIAHGAVWTVIAANAAWTAASFVLLAGGWVAPTALGIMFVAGQAIAVAALGALQYAVLRYTRAVAA